MKKILILAVLVTAVAAQAQPDPNLPLLHANPKRTNNRHQTQPAPKHNSKLLQSSLYRAVAGAQLSWKYQLAQIQTKYQEVRPKKETYAALPFETNRLSSTQERTYLLRLVLLQKLIHANKAIKNYTFVAPDPADLAHLSYYNYVTLQAFLLDLKTAQVTGTQHVRPYTLAVHVKGVPQGQLELWIDVPTKKVYLMSNNLYSTAIGKYGPRWK